MSRMIFRPVVAGRVQVEPLTVREYDRLVESGELPEDTSIELIRGFLTPKDRAAAGEDPMTIGNQHILAIQKIMRLSEMIERHACHLRIQQPIGLPPLDEPEPDASIVVGKPEDFAERKPGASDVVCVIEVADSSLRRDRAVKLEVYAAGGIKQYVIVNLPDHMIELFTLPVKQSSRYRKQQTFRSNDILSITIGKKTIDIPVKKILP